MSFSHLPALLASCFARLASALDPRTALRKHPERGTIALPLCNELYIRQQNLAQLAPDHRRPFRTKLALAAAQLHWVCAWRGHRYAEVWAVVDGGYSKRPFLRAAQQE